MRFPPSVLDEIRARLPVSAVVGRRVPLKRAGREFRGLSPFKSEKTPSFFVNDHKGFYHCFASGEHGDIFTFLMKTEGLSFPEAVERLAAEAGVSLPKPDPRSVEQEDRRGRLLDLMEAAAAYFEGQLHATAGREASRYLERRGLKRETITSFRLGFAPASRTALKDHLAKAGFSTPEMIETGMLIAGEDIPTPYDRFRNRVMFPISDLKGRIIAFGGRALDPDAPAKYLNSPETPLFHKGAILFNAARARQAAHDTGHIIAVEGYMDVVGLSQGGFAHAVAPLGTALTEDQVRLLWRLADEPILCFDGDGAGRKAAHRAVDTILPLLEPARSITFAFLDNGDPDDVIRDQGPAAFQGVLDRRRNLIDVLWQREIDLAPLATPEQRAGLEQRLNRLTGTIANASVRNQYEREIRQRLWDLTRSLSPRTPRTERSPGVGRTRAFDGTRAGMPPADWRARERHRLGWPRDERRTAALPLAPSAPGLASRLSEIPAREVTLLRTLLNHPWLLDEHCEELAALTLTSDALARLRDGILAVHAKDIPLDTSTLRHHLTQLGLDGVLALAERAASHKSVRFAEPDADPALVVNGWRHALALHSRYVELQHALEAAEQAFNSDGSESAWQRLCEVRALVNGGLTSETAAEGMGTGGEAPHS